MAGAAQRLVDTLYQQLDSRKDPKHVLKTLEAFYDVQPKAQKKQTEVTHTHQLGPSFDFSKLSDEEFQMYQALVEKMRPQSVEDTTPHKLIEGTVADE